MQQKTLLGLGELTALSRPSGMDRAERGREGNGK